VKVAMTSGQSLEVVVTSLPGSQMPPPGSDVTVELPARHLVPLRDGPPISDVELEGR